LTKPLKRSKCGSGAFIFARREFIGIGDVQRSCPPFRKRRFGRFAPSDTRSNQTRPEPLRMRRDRSWSDCPTGSTGDRNCDLMRSGPHTLQRGSVRREAVRRRGISSPLSGQGNRRTQKTKPKPFPYPHLFAFQQFCALCTTLDKIPNPDFADQLNRKRSEQNAGRKIAEPEIRALRAGACHPPP
jgi:hypothetical protein